MGKSVSQKRSRPAAAEAEDDVSDGSCALSRGHSVVQPQRPVKEASSKLQSAAKKGPDDGQWVCAICTLHNPRDLQVCGACGAEQAQVGTVKCPTCTFANPAGYSACEICGAASPIPRRSNRMGAQSCNDSVDTSKHE